MERDKKRKRKRRRAEKAEASKAGDQLTSQVREPAEEVAAAAAEASPPPTEEEVEEFFAILRRMRVAAKYLEKEALNSKSGGKEPQKSAAEGSGNRVAGLDLNTVPEAESSSV